MGVGNVREDEGPTQADIEKFGGDSRPCPHCGAMVYDDAEWCHKCGQVLGDGVEKPVSKRWVIVAVVLLVLVLTFVAFR